MNGVNRRLAEAANTLSQLLHDNSCLQSNLVVAFSGGVDSTALLLTAKAVAERHHVRLYACYVNHQLSPHAHAWQAHCQQLCQQLNIEFFAKAVTVDTKARTSLENEARKQRYAVLTEYCKKHNAVLLLGHHQQDQLETVLLQLKRGAGPKGLSGMGPASLRSGVWRFRPLLNLTKRDLVEAVSEHQIAWCEDESNDNQQIERNFLRCAVLPVLTERWPQLSQTVSRSAKLCAEYTEMIEEMASRYLFDAVDADDHSLDVSVLYTLTFSWQKAVVRKWLESYANQLVSEKRLFAIIQMITSGEDKQPRVDLKDCSVRRYHNRLYLVSEISCTIEPTLRVSDGERVVLPWLNQTIIISSQTNSDSDYVLRTGDLAITVKPVDQAVSKPLRKWLKAWRVPVWERAATTLLYQKDKPIAVILKNRVVKLVDADGVTIVCQSCPNSN